MVAFHRFTRGYLYSSIFPVESSFLVTPAFLSFSDLENIWWLGTCLRSHILGIIIQIDYTMFFRGLAQPPTISIDYPYTNHIPNSLRPQDDVVRPAPAAPAAPAQVAKPGGPFSSWKTRRRRGDSRWIVKNS